MAEGSLERRIAQRLGRAAIVLDVGCGDGRLVNFLARELNKRVVGLDISSHGFAHAQEEAAKAYLEALVECVKGDAQRMEAFADSQFDAVTVVYTLHHIDSPEAALGEIRRVLKPGGKLLVGDLVVAEEQAKSACYRFTAGEVREMLERAAFGRVEAEHLEADLVLVVGEKEAEDGPTL